MLRRDTEISEDERNNENVVHRKGQLDEIAGQELERFGLTTHGPEPERKEHCQTKPDGRPQQGFAKTNGVGSMMKNTEIEGDQDDDDAYERSPMPPGDLDERKHQRPRERLARDLAIIPAF